MLVPHRPVRREPLAATGRNNGVNLEVPRAFDDQTDWMGQLRQVRWFDLPPQWKLPLLRGVDVKPILLFLHGFSGRRRHEDFHFWLKELGRQRGYDVRVLSVDTAINLTLGNMSRGAGPWEHICRCLRAGVISGSLLGPPCETYSEARHHQVDPSTTGTGNTADNRRWPRPLRSKERILGLNGLSSREQRQLGVGTAFLFQAFHVVAMHIAWGGYAAVEHPGRPSDPGRASAWSTAIAELLCQNPSVVLHTLHQWRWGSVACKPTGFLVHSMPKFFGSMWRRHDPLASFPGQEIIGRDEQGRFRTSQLKEYPSRLCFALARAFLDQAQADIAAGRSCVVGDVPSEVMEWVSEVASVSSKIHHNASIGADYQEL
eukprot:Skav213731  [mRNA]  locus=scaffold2563:294182:295300:+ [translate_table: standard]